MTVEELRLDFPLLSTEVAYLDNAATTQKPAAVLESLQHFYRSHNANVHRGVYELAEQATRLFEDARARVARFLSASSDEVIITSGATAGLNLLALGLEESLGQGRAIYTTELEHHANFLPWQRLARRTEGSFHALPFDSVGNLDLAAVELEFRQNPPVVLAFSLTSHVLGNRLPAEDLIRLARHYGVNWVVVDATQSPLCESLSLARIGADALVLSSHKSLGPTGVGVLCVTAKLQAQLTPVNLGGGMVMEVYRDRPPVWRSGPWRFEAGTPPIADAIAFAAALDYIEAKNLLLEPWALHLSEQLALGLAELPHVKMHGWAAHLNSGGAKPRHGAIVSWSVAGIHPHDLAQEFADHGVAVRAGLHCAQPCFARLELPFGAVRASFAPYNTLAEVGRALDIMKRVVTK